MSGIDHHHGASPVSPPLPGEAVAIIPMKDLASAKTRLSPHLDCDQRTDLVLRMFTDVVQAARECSLIDAVHVVGGDEQIHAVSRTLDAQWHPQPRQGQRTSLNEAIMSVAENVHLAQRTRVVLTGDIPLITAPDIAALVTQAGKWERSFVPDACGDGTTAVVWSAGIASDCHFGPNSATTHQQHGFIPLQLAQLGLPYMRLCRDVDTIADLNSLTVAAGDSQVAEWMRGWRCESEHYTNSSPMHPA